jgi:hypothetical protein
MTARRLTARYRRLLWAYPPGRRREELLDTLVEAAPEGRRRPTVGETLNLLRHGMRARLGRPASRGVVVIAVLFSLVGGYVAGAVAYRIALEGAPGVPHGAELAETQAVLFPGQTSWAEADGEVLSDLNSPTLTDVLRGGNDEDFFYATVTIGPGDRFLAGDYRAWTEQAAARLAAQGWDAGRVAATGATDDGSGDLVQDGTWLRARRGDLTMELNTGTSAVDVPAGSFDVTATVWRFPPRSAAAWALAAGLPAAFLTWLLFGWASRRTEGATVPVRFLTREPVVVATVVLFPIWFSGAGSFVVEALRLQPVRQPFFALPVGGGYSFAMVAGTLCLLALVVAIAAGGAEVVVEEPA